MTYFMFQDKNGIKLYLEEQEKHVEEPTKEKEMWIFADTECRVDKRVIFKWNSLFQAFQDKEFQILL